MPTGQLEADARTVVAAFSYLLHREDNSAWPATTMAACADNFAVPPETAAAFCWISNQADLLCEPITNQPARS